MARPSLAELKNRFKEKGEKKNENRTNNFQDGLFYPFWLMKAGEEAVVHLIPDADEDNPDQFYIEKSDHKLSVNGKDVRFACLEMYGAIGDCPVCDRSRKYYKAAGKNNPSPEGKYYYKNKNSLVRVMIIKDPIVPEAGKESHTGKVRVLSLTKQVIQRIIDSMSEFSDTDPYPWDLEKGFNFIIRKSEFTASDGKKQASYTGSSFSRSATPVPAEYHEAMIPTQLKLLLPKNPGLEYVVAQLESHDTGKEFTDTSTQSDGQDQQVQETKPVTEVVKPTTQTSTQVEHTATVQSPVTTTTVIEEPPKTVTAPQVTASVGDDDIMARIKNRNKPKV